MRSKLIIGSDGKIPSCDNCKWLEPCYHNCFDCDAEEGCPSEWTDMNEEPEESNADQ